MSAPEPPVGFIGRTEDGHAIERGGAGWYYAGSSNRFSWEQVQQFDRLTPLYTPPVATLVERMVEEYTVAVGHEENGMQAALAEVAAWVAEQRHLDYREDLLAALRAEAGQSDG